MDKERMKSLLPYIGIPILLIAFLVIRWKSMSGFELLQGELLLGIGYFAVVSDIREKRISNQLVLTLLAAWFLSIFPQLSVGVDRFLELLGAAALGFAVGGGLFLAVYLISRGGLGGGDVKFMATAGLYMGMTGILQSMLLGSTLAALCGLTLIALKKIGKKDTIPLMPFLYVGILATLFLL